MYRSRNHFICTLTVSELELQQEPVIAQHILTTRISCTSSFSQFLAGGSGLVAVESSNPKTAGFIPRSLEFVLVHCWSFSLSLHLSTSPTR